MACSRAVGKAELPKPTSNNQGASYLGAMDKGTAILSLDLNHRSSGKRCVDASGGGASNSSRFNRTRVLHGASRGRQSGTLVVLGGGTSSSSSDSDSRTAKGSRDEGSLKGVGTNGTTSISAY